MAAGLAARIAAVTCGLSLDGFAAGFVSSLVTVKVVSFFFFVPLSLSSFSSVAIGLSGIRAALFALSVGGEALAGGFFLLSLSEGAISVVFVGSFFGFVVVGFSLSGVGGGVGCSRRLGLIEPQA